MSDLLCLTVCEAARLLRQGEVEPADLDRAVREALCTRNAELNACSWLSDPAQEPAPQGQAPRRTEAPLWGIGGVIKANIASRSQPTDCSSQSLAGYCPPYDATVVARLRAAGAYLLGKSNMDEFAMGSSTEHSSWGPTRNPHDLGRSAGGSSGGSAAAVAADLAYFALGSDTGGSVRQPAHCCGLVGLKPTYGRISRYGLVAFASSLDQIGPLTKDVADAACIYAVLAGHDPRDATSLATAVGDPEAAPERSVRGLKVGVPWHALAEGLDADVSADFQSTLADLTEQGAEVVEISLPTLPYAVAVYAVLSAAEASANLARFDGVRYGTRQDGPDRLAMIERCRTAGFGAEVKRRILLGTFVLSAGYHDAYYGKAQRVRQKLAADYVRAFEICDAVATPTAPTAAFALREELEDPLQMTLCDVFTVPANLTGLPAISVPTGWNASHLPLSIHLTAPALAEERLFCLAGSVERARDFRRRKPAP